MNTASKPCQKKKKSNGNGPIFRGLPVVIRMDCKYYTCMQTSVITWQDAYHYGAL